MTRPFDPRDIGRVRGLQQTGCSLDVEGDVLVGRSPLFHAVAGLAPWSAGRVLTLVERVDAPSREPAPQRCGVLQMRPRRGGRACDIVFVAPTLNAGSGGHLLWQRLLIDAGRIVGVRGVEKLSIAVSTDDSSALAVLRQGGFAPSGTDVVLRRDAGPVAASRSERQAVSAGRDLAEEVRNLAANVEPRAGADIWTEYPAGGWLSSTSGLRTMVTPTTGSVEAAWRVFSGRNGVWLHLIGLGSADPGAAVQAAVADCGAGSPGPVYCAVPESSELLLSALQDVGFTMKVRRVHLTKPTAARIIEPVWDLRRSTERALDPAKAAPRD